MKLNIFQLQVSNSRCNFLLFNFELVTRNWNEESLTFELETQTVMTVYSVHVTYAFQSESTLYSCLNVKEILAWNRSKIWSLSDYRGTLTYNHLDCKQTLNHLAKLASLAKWLIVRLRTKSLWVQVPLQSLIV